MLVPKGALAAGRDHRCNSSIRAPYKHLCVSQSHNSIFLDERSETWKSSELISPTREAPPLPLTPQPEDQAKPGGSAFRDGFMPLSPEDYEDLMCQIFQQSIWII